MADSFVIEGLAGKKRLAGAITVGGAKNEALKLMAASVLYAGPARFENMPEIEDVKRMREILEALGAKVEIEGTSCAIVTDGLRGGVIDPALGRSLRSSVVLTGPLLARTGSATFPHPGGDLIGERPIDFFIEGFEKMGARAEVEEGNYTISAPGGLRGADIFFRWVSVTATETLMMAAVLAKGPTTLRNVAMEPEVADLANFLVAGGALISGIGTPTLVIEGREGALLAPPARWRCIPDRIEAGSFLILGALAAKELTIEACEPEHLRMIIELLSRSGVSIEARADSIYIHNGGEDARKAIALKTHEYPGFPTDLQAPMVVYLTQAEGESKIFETIFEGRLNYTEDLKRMGAAINLWNPHQATIKGPTPLHGATLESPDIRAGLAFLIAALIAEGKSTLSNIYHIERGYGRLEERLTAIGAPILRVRE